MDKASIALIIAVLAVAGVMMATGATLRRRRKLKKVQENINLGDDVQTVGGIYGVVISFTENEVTIESGEKGSEVVVSRGAITAASHRTGFGTCGEMDGLH